jgi:hypothetical protein
MNKKLDRAVTRKLDKNFDKSFWKKFDKKYSKKSENEQNWQRLFAPLAMACALLVLTINLYSGGDDYSKKQLEDFMVEVNEVDTLIDSATVDLDGEYYALID